MQTDGLTDMTKQIVAFHNFLDTSKNEVHSSSYPMSIFKELYHELLTIKNCVAKLLAQP
jgi:hypothetical protein